MADEPKILEGEIVKTSLGYTPPPPGQKPADGNGRTGYRKWKVAEVAEVLNQTAGTIALAAERLGAADMTIRKYVKESPTLQTIVAHYRERRVDKAEIKLEEAIARGEPWAIALTLKTLGKGRGYVERREIQHGALSADDLQEMTDEQLDALITDVDS